MRIQEIIRRPLITEKSSLQREGTNVLTLEVDTRANKIEIQRAVETQFKVKVAEVRVAKMHGKVRRQGRFAGRRADWKKAFVRWLRVRRPSTSSKARKKESLGRWEFDNSDLRTHRAGFRVFRISRRSRRAVRSSR